VMIPKSQNWGFEKKPGKQDAQTLSLSGVTLYA